MPYLLKVLSGALNGVEYSLADGDTVFHVGPHQGLIDGTASQLLGGVGNAFFLPEETPPAAFLIRIDADTDVPAISLGVRDDATAAWQLSPLPTQQVMQAAGIHFAVRAADAAWVDEVTGFSAPTAVAIAEPALGSGLDAARLRRMRSPWLLGTVGLLLLTLLGTWVYWQYRPEVRARGLATILHDAPMDYQVLPGSNDRLYVFSEDAAGKIWGERASRRLQRRDDTYLVRSAEARRVEDLLEQAGHAVVVVRLQDPAQPQIYLNGEVNEARRRRVVSLLEGQLPYVQQLQVAGIGDAQLIALAREALRVVGISSRTEPRGQRISVINDVYLDDAALNAMARTTRRFHAQWGQRRLTIQPQLWDDLLQGRSYRHSPGQLLSIGSGRWEYSHAAGYAPAAVP